MFYKVSALCFVKPDEQSQETVEMFQGYTNTSKVSGAGE